jgi:hypothetical protein
MTQSGKINSTVKKKVWQLTEKKLTTNATQHSVQLTVGTRRVF